MISLELKGSYLEVLQEVKKLFPKEFEEKFRTPQDITATVFDSALALVDVPHFSESKSRYIEMEEMDTVYLVNVLKKLVSNNKASKVLEEDEFSSLILHLATRIIEDEVGVTLLEHS